MSDGIRTDDAIKAMRNRLIESFMTEGAPVLKMITCDECLMRFKCDFSYDPISVNGDCAVIELS